MDHPTDPNKRIIEIGGVKVEVDLRTATVIETFRVGDHVKILESSGSGGTMYNGVITGIVQFEKKVGVEVLYLSYSDVGFLTITEDNPKYSLAPVSKEEQLFSETTVDQMLARRVNEAEVALEKAKQRQTHFLAAIRTARVRSNKA